MNSNVIRKIIKKVIHSPNEASASTMSKYANLRLALSKASIYVK